MIRVVLLQARGGIRLCPLLAVISTDRRNTAPHGEICPAPRRRSRLALTLVEREEISRGIARDESIRSMAETLGPSPSTVSREIARNGGYARYRAALADERAWASARRPKRCKLAGTGDYA